MNKTDMTDAEIETFRAALMENPWARNTDAPYVCARALKIARGKCQIEAKRQARAAVLAAYNTWLMAGGGYVATVETLWPGSVR